MNRSRLAALMRAAIIFLLMMGTTGCSKDRSGKLQLAVSANMQYAMAEIASSFEASQGVACELIVGSSGKLTAQILEGAPFDVFLSADMTYPGILHDRGLAEGPPAVYAYGKLVLWTAKEDLEPSMEVLASERVRHLAVASPELAPYGKAAIQVLERLGRREELEGKMVFGESISQTSQFVATGAAEFGFTSKSVVLSPGVRELGRWMEVDGDLYEPIEQGLIVLKGPPEKVALAEAFKRFLFSDKGRRVLEHYGYQPAMNQ